MRYILSACFAIAVALLAFRPFQDFTVTGVVKDQHGQPLANVTVMEKQNIKGVHEGTVTGADGSFSLTVSAPKTILIFALAGYEQQEMKINGTGKPVNIMLKLTSQPAREVALGYSNAKTEYDEAEPSTTFHKQSPLSSRASGSLARVKRKDAVGADKRYVDPNADTSDFNTEEYDAIVENRFKTVTDNPLSTFSIDVDGGSYSNVRRYLKMGQMPPTGAVRIEELINYFHYDYPQPTGENPFSINTEISECAWSPNHKLIMIGLQGKKIPVADLPASNLVFLIDVSGSMMEPEKLPLVQNSLKMLVDQLREQDRVSLVVYAGNAGLVMPSTPGNQKIKIKDAIDRLEAGGSTAGGAGIRLAYKVAEQNLVMGGNNRVILCTDGDFNVGPSSDSDLEGIIEKERKSGVFLTVLGYGMGNYKDSKMEKLADKGNGNHAYIDNENEAKKVLVNEFGGTLFTIAKDVKLQIEFNPAKVQSYRLIGYENRMLNKEDFNNDNKDAGELGSGHTVTAIYEIIPAGVKNEFFESVDSLKYQRNINPKRNGTGNELMTVKFRYKNPEGDKSKLIVHAVNDRQLSLDETSTNFRFVSAVAQFGMLMRNSEFKQNASYTRTYALAKNALGKDSEGYRKEFLQLIQVADKLAKSETVIEEDRVSGIK